MGGVVKAPRSFGPLRFVKNRQMLIAESCITLRFMKKNPSAYVADSVHYAAFFRAGVNELDGAMQPDDGNPQHVFNQ